MSTLLLLVNWFYQFIYAHLFVHLFQYFPKILVPASPSSTNNGHNHSVSPSIESSRYENIISLTCSYAWQVMTKNIDVDYPDVKRKVLNSTLVMRTITKISQNEYNLLLNKSDNVVVNDRQNQQPTKNLIETPSDRNNQQQDRLRKLIRKNQQKALEHFMQMQSSISSSLVRIASWILYRLLSRIFTSIQFNKVQIGLIRDRIKQINGDGSSPNIPPVPTLYLPVYRSHLDSILISFILSMNNLSPPLVAIDEHLSVPFFGNLMRGLGAFFLKSSQNDQNNDPDDLQLYNAVLRSYLIENLSVGNSLELFLVDPSDNSNGKSLAAVPEENHLLSIVMDALADGSVQQVNVVPVSISYEKSIDDPLVTTSNGSIVTDNNKNRNRKLAKQETFVSTLKIIWSTLRSNYGTVRVDFGKPFLLKDYVNQIVSQKELFEHCQAILFDDAINDGNKRLNINGNPDTNEKQSSETSEHPIEKNNGYVSQSVVEKNCVACGYNFVPTKATEEKFSNGLITISKNDETEKEHITTEFRIETLDEGDGGGIVRKPESDQFDRLKPICIDLLVKHVRSDVDRDSALMSTHLVSFILLNKYRRKGTTIDQLSMDIDWLRQTIRRDKQLNLSISGDSQSLIRQAIHLMGQKLITTENVRLKWSSWNNGNNGNSYNNYTNDSRWSNNQFVDTQSNGGYFSLTNSGQKNMRNSQPDLSSKQRYSNKNSARIEIIYLKPADNSNSILCLQRYSNQCAKLFKYESVIAMSLFSFVNTDLSALIYDPSTFVSNLSINKNEFVQRCRRICSILQFEIIFTKSCQSWDRMLEKTFENSFVKQDVFVLNPNKPTGITLPMSDVNHSQYHHHNHSQTIDSNHCQNQKPYSTMIRNRRRSSPAHRKRCILKPVEGSLQNECILEVDENDLDHLDGDEQQTPPNEFYIRLTEKNKQLLSLYCSILEPYMQAYLLISQKLSETVADHNHRIIDHKSIIKTDSQSSSSKLQTAIVDEKSFYDQMIRISLTMANNGFIRYESTSLQTFKNAIKYFILIGAIQRKRGKQEEKNDAENSQRDGKNKSCIEGTVSHVSAEITKEYSKQPNSSTTTTTLLSFTMEQKQILVKSADTMKAFVRVCPKNSKQNHHKH